MSSTGGGAFSVLFSGGWTLPQNRPSLQSMNRVARPPEMDFASSPPVPTDRFPQHSLQPELLALLQESRAAGDVRHASVYCLLSLPTYPAILFHLRFAVSRECRSLSANVNDANQSAVNVWRMIPKNCC